MSTTTITLTCAQSGTSYTTNLNGALSAVDTCHSGTTAPSTNVVQGKMWLDTSAGDMVLKIYDGSSWLPMLNLEGGTMKSEKALLADKLTTARTVTVSGDASGSFTFDGSANVSLVLSADGKADLAGLASQSFSATTASAATNTTQVATTEYVTSAVAANAAFPIGAVFTTVAVYADSAAVVAALGGTTWVSFAAGRMLIGVDGTYANGATGGEATHTLTEAEMPSHKHDAGTKIRGTTGTDPSCPYGEASTSNDNGWDSHKVGQAMKTCYSDTVGSDTAHNNLPPYIAVYMWKRTA